MAASDLPPRVVLDSGSGFVKAGWAGQLAPKVVMPNCAGQLRKKQYSSFLGDQCYTLAEYFCHRPFSNGLVVDPDLQRDIWDRVFGRGYMGCHPEDLAICITEPYLTPSTIRHCLTEILFEDFGFKRMLICPAQMAVPYGFWGLHWGQFDILQMATRFGLPACTCYIGNEEANRSSLSPDPCEHLCEVADPYTNHVLLTKKKEAIGGFQDGGNLLETKGSLRLSTIVKPMRSKDAAYNETDPNFMQPANKKAKEAASYSSRNPCSIVVDCGFSCTQVMPFFEYQPLEKAALRIDLGGTHLNAHLKNLVSYRTISLEQNELLVQHMKEASCFVSQDYVKQMSIAHFELKHPKSHRGLNKTHLHYTYTLPDFNVKNKSLLVDFFNSHPPTNSAILSNGIPSEADRLGIILKDAADTENDAESTEVTAGFTSAVETEARQTVVLNNERISVPEILFFPKDARSEECSIPELIYRSISLAPIEMQPFLAQQILLVGGTTNLPGFRARLWKELRCMLPKDWKICIYQHQNSQNSVWAGASQWANDESVFSMYSITRQEFCDSGRDATDKPYVPLVE